MGQGEAPVRTPTLLSRFRHDDGDIISGWLIQLVVIMAIVAVVGYEFVAVMTTVFSMEDEARDVARAAASSYKRDESIPKAQEIAEEVATRKDVELISIEIDGNRLIAVVSREAETLFLHRFSLFDGLTHPSTDGSARLDL